MIMKIRKKRLAVAVAGAVSLVAATAQAEEFTASATLQNTLTVVVVQDFDIGTVFATETGADAAAGVGALVIAPDGGVSEPIGGDSTTVNLTSLSTPAPAQGSVAMAADFTLTFPDTRNADATTFGAAGSATITTTGNGVPLDHISGDPDVPSLYLVHFTIGDVSGGVSGLVPTTGVVNDGKFFVAQDFGETDFVFNIGATITTEPFGVTTTGSTYQAGVYSGTFEVTAAY